jgi:hypothetical protein
MYLNCKKHVVIMIDDMDSKEVDLISDAIHHTKKQRLAILPCRTIESNTKVWISEDSSCYVRIKA